MSKTHRVNFDDLKARADFRAVLAHYSLKPVGSGDQTKVPCPFHDDARPSCSVNLEKRLFHCFGCGAKGNVLEFVHRMEALESSNGATVSLRAAGVRLAEICGLPVATGTRHGARKPPDGPHQPRARDEGPSTSTAATTRQEPRRAATAKETAVSPSRGQNRALGRPERQETASEERTDPKRNRPLGFRLTVDAAHPYLSKRGIPPELVERFGLGFCAQGSMAGRIAIPIENAAGELVAYAGRWVGSEAELPEGEEKYKLPKGFQKSLELFNLHRVKHCRHLIVVEGFFGAMHLHGLRFPAVALMGSSLSEEQVGLLLEHCPTLRFATVLMDGDEPGRKAADTVAARLAQSWWTRIVHLAEGAQPDTVEPAELGRLLGRGER